MYNGEKVQLRELRKEDLPIAFKYLNSAEGQKFLVPGIPAPMRWEEEEEWYRGLSEKKDHFQFAIETLEDKKFIGGCSIFHINWKNSHCAVGIAIYDEAYQSKGYGTDAMKILVKFIFEQMNLNKVKLFVFSYNERAIKSYEKCGFKREGVLRQEIFRDGKYHDSYTMGILKEEYFAGSESK